MKSLYEEMGGTYHQEGDYLIPNLTVSESGTYQLGKYGRMRRRYLKEYHSAAYTTLFINGTLFEHLEEIDQTCHNRMEHLCTAMAQREGINETLKANNQMEWVRRMNNIRNRAEEIVYAELIYAEQ